MAFKIIPLAISLVLLGISPRTQAHKDGPGTHTAERHDVMASLAYGVIHKYNKDEICTGNPFQAMEDALNHSRNHPSTDPDIFWKQTQALIHAGKDEAEKRCRILTGKDQPNKPE